MIIIKGESQTLRISVLHMENQYAITYLTPSAARHALSYNQSKKQS